MTTDTKPAVNTADVPRRKVHSIYPEPFASRMAGREKYVLGDLFGIKKFGVNLTKLAPGAQSALLHKHSLQEEFIYILTGHPTLVTDHGETELSPGMCAGFTPDGAAHQLVNRTKAEVTYLEVGDRIPGDKVSYPADDLVAAYDGEGRWQFTHKNGDPY